MANPNVTPFAGTFPAHDAADDHADAWPSIEDPDVPEAPETPEGPDVDTGTLPDDAPPIDLVTGLPNSALTILSDEVPDEAEDHALAKHADFNSWL